MLDKNKPLIWENLTKQEKEQFFAEAVKEATDELHSKGLPYVIGAEGGIYEVYPDGSKIFTPSLYKFPYK